MDRFIAATALLAFFFIFIIIVSNTATAETQTPVSGRAVIPNLCKAEEPEFVIMNESVATPAVEKESFTIITRDYEEGQDRNRPQGKGTSNGTFGPSMCAQAGGWTKGYNTIVVKVVRDGNHTTVEVDQIIDNPDSTPEIGLPDETV